MTIELKLSFVQNPSCLPLSLVVSLDVCRFSQEELRPKFEAVAGAKKRLFDFERWKDEECGFSDGDKFMSSDASTNSIVGHNCWMGHLFHLVASVTWISELESVHQILPLGWSCRIFYSAAYVSHFFPNKKFYNIPKDMPKSFLSDLKHFWKGLIHLFIFCCSQRGLWEQRQGFLTAAAKREQQHLAEAEAEVLRHVAKLVPEAEAPTNSSGKMGCLGSLINGISVMNFCSSNFAGKSTKMKVSVCGETSRNP